MIRDNSTASYQTTIQISTIGLPLPTSPIQESTGTCFLFFRSVRRPPDPDTTGYNKGTYRGKTLRPHCCKKRRACSGMGTTSIQDRTAEFRTVLAQAQKNISSRKVGGQRQSLLSDAQRQAANGSPNGTAKGPRRGARSEFARKAADVGRGITGTMEKLERLAQRL